MLHEKKLQLDDLKELQFYVVSEKTFFMKKDGQLLCHLGVKRF